MHAPFEAQVLAEAAALGLSGVELWSAGGVVVGRYVAAGVPAVLVAGPGGAPVEHYARLSGALRSSVIYAPGPARPLWFAGQDADLAAWLDGHPEAAWPLVWQHRGGWLPWGAQLRPRGGESLLVTLAGEDGTTGLARHLGALSAASRIVAGGSHPERPFLAEPPGHAHALHAFVRSSAPAVPAGAQVSAFVAGAPEVAALQASLQARVAAPTGSPEAAINAAAKLLVGGRYAEAIEAYTAVAAAHPERAATAASQIGAAQYFLGRYGDAIASYRRAIDLGEDPSMMADNIAEAEEALRRGGTR